MDYELYWHKPFSNQSPSDMVIGGSFGKIKDARKTAFEYIMHVSKKEIEIYNFTSYGNILFVGTVRRFNHTVRYVDYRGRVYPLFKDGSIGKQLRV